MSTTVATARQSDLVGSLDNLRPTPAKAGLHRTSQSDALGSSDDLGLEGVIQRALLAHYGSVKAAAISLNVDPSLMQRELEAGKISRLNIADPEAKAAIADAIYKAFGRLEDPKARAMRRMKELVDCAKDIEAYLEYVS